MRATCAGAATKLQQSAAEQLGIVAVPLVRSHAAQCITPPESCMTIFAVDAADITGTVTVTAASAWPAKARLKAATSKTARNRRKEKALMRG